MIVTVVLQNPYAKGTLANGWNPARWQAEFRKSRTGSRLQRALPDCVQVKYTNANPMLGDNADSIFEARPKHLCRVFRRIKPDVVLACGVVAEEVCVQVWPGSLIAIPHPACRVLTNKLLAETNAILCMWTNAIEARGRIALRQKRGSIKQEQLS